MEKIQQENKICVLVGDFNIDLFKHNDSQEIISTFNSNFYFNTITKPTRVTPTSATLIDHMWTNNLKNLSMSGILYVNLSDHFPVFANFKGVEGLKVSKKKTIEYRDFNEASIDNFKALSPIFRPL